MSVVNSPFLNSLTSQVSRIREIIKSPKLVDTHFDELINIHNSIADSFAEYVNTTQTTLFTELKQTLQTYSQKYKTSYKTDINNLDELNKTILHDSHSIKVKSLKCSLQNSFDNIQPELFDVSIYEELSEYVDPSITKMSAGNLTPEQSQTIKAFKEIREEIEEGLDEFIKDVKKFEKQSLNIKQNLIKKGMSNLDILYIMHLNYLKAYCKNSTLTTFDDYKLNGKIPEKYGKQSEWLNKYYEEL